MRNLATVLLVALVLSGCRIFRAEEWSRRDECARTLPVLRAEPPEPYRVVRIVEARSDDDLAWQACAEGAEAVISSMSSESETHIGGIIAGGVVAGKATTKERSMLRGIAIRYVRSSTASAQ